jgi:hypothetical protein
MMEAPAAAGRFVCESNSTGWNCCLYFSGRTFRDSFRTISWFINQTSDLVLK